MRVLEFLYITVAPIYKKTYNFGFLEDKMTAPRIKNYEKLYAFDKLLLGIPKVRNVSPDKVHTFRMACYDYARLVGVTITTRILLTTPTLVKVQVLKTAPTPKTTRSPGTKTVRIDSLRFGQLRALPFSRMRKGATIRLLCASHSVVTGVYEFLKKELASADHYYSIRATPMMEIFVRCVVKDKRTRFHNQKKQRNRYPFVDMQVGDRLYFYPPTYGVQHPINTARSSCEYAENRYNMKIEFHSDKGLIYAQRVA